jgi:signal transduction histidine kinase
MYRTVCPILFFIISFIFGNVEVAANNIGGVKLNLASPFLYYQTKDSLLAEKYKKTLNEFEREEYSKSLELGLELLMELKNSENTELVYLSNFLVGRCFSKINDHNKSIFYFNKSLRLLGQASALDKPKLNSYFDSNKKHFFLADNLLKIGVEYSRLKKTDSAIFYYKKIDQINSLDEGLLSVKASAYNNLSATYIELGKYDLAKKYALEAVKIRRINKNSLNEASALTNLASIFILEKNFKEAKRIYIKAIDLIDKDKSSVALRYREDLYFNLAWALYNLKDFTAYDYQEKSYTIKDSLRNIEFEHIVQQVYEKYQFDIAKKQASTAASDFKLRELEEKNTILFFIVLIILVLLSSGVIMFNYKLRQKNLNLQLTQTELTQKNKLEKVRSEAQVRILNATLDGKEAERKQIAETLHDSVSSLLSSANLHLQASKMQFNGETPIEIDKTQKIITEASQAIRDLSHTLVSSVLLKFGLKYAINEMSEKYSNSQLQISTDITNVRRYHQSFEIKANNIIQEFVNNILKHSHASIATVKINEFEGRLKIQIQDNGEGFDETKISSKDGLGINQIHARIQMMNGKFLIESTIGVGTTVLAELPIMEKSGVIHVARVL